MRPESLCGPPGAALAAVHTPQLRFLSSGTGAIPGRKIAPICINDAAPAEAPTAYSAIARLTLMIVTGCASIWPFITPSPLSGSTGASKIARTTSIPSTTRPNAA